MTDHVILARRCSHSHALRWPRPLWFLEVLIRTIGRTISGTRAGLSRRTIEADIERCDYEATWRIEGLGPSPTEWCDGCLVLALPCIDTGPVPLVLLRVRRIEGCP